MQLKPLFSGRNCLSLGDLLTALRLLLAVLSGLLFVRLSLVLVML